MATKRKKLESFNIELVDDVLIKIFDLLTVEQRKPAKLVCHSWNRVLCHHRFTSQNPFVLDNCFISEKCPPWTIIRNAAEPITNLHLGTVIEYDEDLIDQKEIFFNEIGPHVTELSVSHSLPLHSFTGLKELTLDCAPSHVKPFALPETVEILRFKTTHWHTCRNLFEMLRTMNKNLKVLKLDTIAVKRNNSGCFRMSNKLNQLMNELYGLHEASSSEYFDGSIIHVDVLPNMNFLNTTFLLDLPDIVELKLLPSITPAKLSNINVKLCCATILTKIRVTIGDQGCFFLHAKVSWPNIRFVRIARSSKSKTACTECMQNMRESCPSIEEISLSILSPSQIDAIFGTFKDMLTSLKIDDLDYIDETRMPIMHRLRSVNFREVPKDIARLRELCKRMPNVREAVMSNSDFQFDLVHLRVLGECWPNLKYLQFKLAANVPEADACKTLQMYFRSLVRYDFKSVHKFWFFKDSIIETFEKIPTLRRLSPDCTYGTYCKLKHRPPMIC